MSFSFYRAFKDREERGEEKVDCNSSSSFPFGIFFPFLPSGTRCCNYVNWRENNGSRVAQCFLWCGSRIYVMGRFLDASPLEEGEEENLMALYIPFHPDLETRVWGRARKAIKESETVEDCVYY